MIVRTIKRIRALRQVDLIAPDAQFLFSKMTDLRFEKGARVRVKQGTVRLGYPLPATSSAPALNRTTVHLGEQATLLFNGPANIAEGTFIRVGNGGTLIFEGDNCVARNAILFCKRQMSIGKRSSLSWNVTLMDDDGHTFFKEDGHPLRRLYRPLILEEDVSVQMNVTIPRGVTIGQGAILSANTVIRKDINPNCLVYQESRLVEKNGISIQV